jgi:hypothetical protein
MDKFGNKTFTLTFGDCSENSYTMKKYGKKDDNGFSNEDLVRIYQLYLGKSELYNLSNYLPPTIEKFPEIYFLIIRNPYQDIADDLFNIMSSEPYLDSDEMIRGVYWDKKKVQYKKVVNSHARYNLCFSDLGEYYESLPYYELKIGRVYNYKKIVPLFSLHSTISNMFSSNFEIEGNYYHDINKCYIGFHRDNERRKVVGFRIGSTFNLNFKFLHGTTQIGNIMNFTLNHGDIYVMSDLATGCVKEKETKIYLKHSAGSCKEALK